MLLAMKKIARNKKKKTILHISTVSTVSGSISRGYRNRKGERCD